VTYPQGVNNALMTDWGLHLYDNICSLVARKGLPWDLAENGSPARDYSKGACPAADDLFERSIILAIPSCLTEQDENDIIAAFEKTLNALA
jgi:hypothetical protein